MGSDRYSDGVITRNDGRGLEQYAIISYGPDGRTDSASQGNDDVLFLFSPGDSVP